MYLSLKKVTVEHYVNNQKVKALLVHIPGNRATLSAPRLYLHVVVCAYMYAMNFCMCYVIAHVLQINLVFPVVTYFL